MVAWDKLVIATIELSLWSHATHVREKIRCAGAGRHLREVPLQEHARAFATRLGLPEVPIICDLRPHMRATPLHHKATLLLLLRLDKGSS